MSKNITLDKRSLEVKASQANHAKAKTVAATIFNILKTSPKQASYVRKALRNLHKVVKSNALHNAEWIYADYIFNGENIDYAKLDKYVKQLEEQELLKPLHERKKYSHAIALTDAQLMQKFLDHGVNFDAQPAAQKKMRGFIDVLCPNGINFVDTQSKNNLLDAIALSQKTGKKLIILSNHVSHMDAVVIDAFFKQLKTQWLIPTHKKVRFIEWVYMALTPGVRQFSIAFNTTKVIWESDMNMLLSSAKKNNKEVTIEYELWDEIKSITTTPITQIKEMKKQVNEKYFTNAENEIWVIFQYAWRGEFGWVKKSINPFMSNFLTSEECIYLSLNMHDTDQLRPTTSDFFVGAHTRFQPFDITVHASVPWIWWQKSLEEIHQLWLQQRDIMRPQFAWIEKKLAHEQYILETQNKISSILSFIDTWWKLSECEIEDYNRLVDMYIDAKSYKM